MVRVLVEDRFITDKRYIEAAGLSTDTKPVEGIITGSMFTEVDTGKVYLFNEDAAAGSEWVEQFSLQG